MQTKKGIPYFVSALCCLLMANPIFSQQQTDAQQSSEDSAVYSGPQVGEKLPKFEIRYAFGDKEGQTFDPIESAGEKPVVLIFVHGKSRLSFGLMRVISQYCSEQKESCSTAICFLTADPTETSTWLQRITRFFEKDIPVGIYFDGQDGPGSYGLNRDVALTVIAGHQNRVKANFALVQPSIEVDGPKILNSIADIIGAEEKPDMTKYSPRRRADANMRMQPEIQKLIRAALNTNATPEEISANLKSIDQMVEKNGQLKTQRQRAAQLVLETLRNQNRMDQKSELSRWATQHARSGRGGDEKLTALLRQFIQKSNSDEQVDKLATQIESYVKENPLALKEIARISKTITNSDRLANYGTEYAQSVLKKWAREFNQEQ